MWYVYKAVKIRGHTLRAVGGRHGDGRDSGRVGRGSVDHEAVLQDDDAVGVVLRRHPARAAAASAGCAELGVECRAETHADVTGAVGWQRLSLVPCVCRL